MSAPDRRKRGRSRGNAARRSLPWDWYDGEIPAGVVMDETAYVETAFSFVLYRSERRDGVVLGRGASTYLGTMFDVGPQGRVTLGECALVHGARIICDSEISIGDHALISWNVVIMDNYRLSADPRKRRDQLTRIGTRNPRHIDAETPARAIRIGNNVWIGFESVILPGVTLGEGSIVGARSVVAADVPPFTIVAGNPARLVRRIEVERRSE